MWTGTAFVMALYVFPAVIKSGTDGGKMMQAITGTNKFPTMLAIVSTVTIITGYLLMWQLSAGFNPAWFESKYGMSLGIGGGFALIAYFMAVFINRPGINRMQAIIAGAAARGGAPSAPERDELMTIRTRVYTSTRWLAIFLAIAVIAMAGARYF
jgi:hypothetical protein